LPPVDRAAFGQLLERHLDRVYGYVARRVEDRETAEALTTVAFRRALEALQDEGLEADSLSGFLFLVATSAVDDHARRMAREIPHGVRARDTDEEGDAERAASTVDEWAMRAFLAAVDGDVLRRQLNRLPDANRRVILLRYFDGLEPDELCASLRCSRQELALELHRALRALRGIDDREATGAA